MSALVKEVTGRKIPWPPENFAFVQPVVSSEKKYSWWSIAKLVGRDNPWDLIIYNFQTEHPREVNYYMRELLGCKDVQGGNYTFEGADPGLLYVPQPSWVPPARFKKGSHRRKYSSSISRTITSTLRRAAPYCPEVRLNGISVSGADLTTVANHIEAGHIDCLIAPEVLRDGAVGQYNTEDDEFMLAREPHGSRQDVTTIAHEAIHAGLDSRGRAVPEMAASVGEVLAFVADGVIGARMFPGEVDRILKGEYLATPDYDIVLAGWALAQDEGTRSVVNLNHLRDIRGNPVRHPHKDLSFNIYNTVYEYARAHYFRGWTDIVKNNGILKAKEEKRSGA